MVVKVLGKQQRTYTDKGTGEIKQYNALHTVRNATANDTGVQGDIVEVISVKFDISNVMVGKKYDLQYDIRGRYAVPAGISEYIEK